jgi:hypothetical protein
MAASMKASRSSLAAMMMVLLAASQMAQARPATKRGLLQVCCLTQLRSCLLAGLCFVFLPPAAKLIVAPFEPSTASMLSTH